jgi:hypothetical protein
MKRSEDKFVLQFEKTFTNENTKKEDIVIAFGDWEERQGVLRGKEPTKGKSMRTMFKKAGYKVHLIDEYRTSKTCCTCGGENEYSKIKRPDPRPWMKNEDQKVWGLSCCSNNKCKTIHNRDKNSSRNILTIAKHIISLGTIPNRFQRGKKEVKQTQTGETSNIKTKTLKTIKKEKLKATKEVHGQSNNNTAVNLVRSVQKGGKKNKLIP